MLAEYPDPADIEPETALLFCLTVSYLDLGLFADAEGAGGGPCAAEALEVASGDAD